MSDSFDTFAAAVRRTYPETGLIFDEPMSRHTTFRVGGTVSLMAEPKSVEAFIWAVRELTARGIDWMVLGNGSNCLFSDRPHPMVVLSTGRLDTLTVMGDTIFCGAGVTLAKLAGAALEAGLTGLEFAHGIPGSLGGAVYMNAGAYGGEMANVISSVTCIDPDGSVHTIAGDQCGFGYRTSKFSKGGVVLGATMTLVPGPVREIRAKMDDLMARRREKQPLNYPSAGSTFKRPANGYASQMIDEAGLKGLTVGGAQVSEKHAGFVVNTGGATFRDVLDVIETVRKEVYKKFGVELEPEVRIIY